MGSDTDRDGGPTGGGADYGSGSNRSWIQQSRGIDPAGGLVREFWLEDTDHITVAILEKDGQLYLIDDLSD